MFMERLYKCHTFIQQLCAILLEESILIMFSEHKIVFCKAAYKARVNKINV